MLPLKEDPLLADPQRIKNHGSITSSTTSITSITNSTVSITSEPSLKSISLHSSQDGLPPKISCARECIECMLGFGCQVWVVVTCNCFQKPVRHTTTHLEDSDDEAA